MNGIPSGTLQPPSALALAAMLLCLGLPPTAHAQVAPGCWVGTLGAGPGQIRAALELRRSGPEWTGWIHRLGGAVDTDSLTSIAVDGDSVSVAFPSTLGAGSAILSGAVLGGEFSGITLSAGRSLPSELSRVDPSVAEPALTLLGYWSGGLYQGGTLALRLGIEFAPAPCGQVIVTLDSPDQGGEDIPVNSVALDGDSLSLGIGSVQGTLLASVSQAGDSFEGLWTQGPVSLPMRMHRSDEPVSFARPQDPTPPFPYTEEEVAYDNDRDGNHFEGTLTIPEGEGPFPAALLITGSGPQDRDEAIMGHRPFRVIADHLARRGVAALRVDDRGVGGSTGSQPDATIDDNVGDALAGISFLRTRSEIDPARMGLVGHSEGGYVGPAVVSESEDVAFVVMLSGPAVTGREILLSQNRAMLEAADVQTIEEELALLETILDIVTTVVDPDEAAERALAAVYGALEALPEEAREERLEAMGGEEALRSQALQNFQLMRSPWFQHLLTFDPVPHLDALDVPVLALFGELDLQVPAEQSVPILEELWADHQDATIHVFPELNHLFQHAETGLLDEYAQIEETFAPEALEMIADWIDERFGD